MILMVYQQLYPFTENVFGTPPFRIQNMTISDRFQSHSVMETEIDFRVTSG